MRLSLLVSWLIITASLGIASDRVVVVHPDTTVSDISMIRLVEMFKADRSFWDSKTRVYLVLPASNTPASKYLLKHVYKMESRDLARHWIQQIYRNKITERPKQFLSTAIMLKVLKKKSGSIAVLDMDDLPKNHGLKILSVDGKNQGDKSYALAERAGKGKQGGVPGEFVLNGVFGSVPANFHGTQDPDLERRMAAIEEQMLDQELAEILGDDQGEGFLNGPRLKLRGFGHVALVGDNTDSSSTGTDNRFALGGLDLFLTSRLGENVSFLNETVFEPAEDGSYVLDVERVVLRYEFDDSFVIETGRFHSKIGRWNELYHHGEFLQTSAARPAILNFEDENGILPVHTVGISFQGKQSMGGMSVDYALEIGNGRGAAPDPPQVIVDENDHKSINLAVSMTPDSQPGLRFGASVYRDKIPQNSDPSVGATRGVIDELITNLFVELGRGDWHFLGEFFDIQHEGSVDTSSTGWLLEVSRRMGSWTPYVRLDGVKLDDRDLFFANVDDSMTTAIGIRHPFSDWSAITVQLEHTELDLAAGGSDRIDSGLIQVSFAF